MGQVAYLLAADSSIGPLLSRLRGAQQLVVRPRNAFSAPRAPLLARCDPDDTPSAVGLDHLGVAQLGQRPPAWLGYGACGLAPRGVHPIPTMGQQARPIMLETIGQ